MILDRWLLFMLLCAVSVGVCVCYHVFVCGVNVELRDGV